MLFLQTTADMLKKHYPILIIIGTLFLVFLTNFSKGGFLIGWDNLQTEINIGLNIKRTIFSVWQEYQGLGLLAGNAHTADLPRQILTLLFSVVIPLSFIRQFYVFLMLFLGVLGTYFLIKKLFFDSVNNLQSKILSLSGALFYLLNLSAIQTFYVPFEPFITHYGFLPWLILSAIMFLKSNTKKNFIFFILINIIAIPQSQVPTVFFVYFLIICLFLLGINLKLRTKQVFNSSIKVILTILALNSFWLFPFIYFLLTNSNVALGAKINQMTTETVFFQNRAFGNLKDVVLLKGFWFNNVDPNLKGNFVYMLAPWRQYLSNPLIEIIGYVFFSVILLGLVSALKSKKIIQLTFVLIFILGFSMLAITTPPFSFIDTLFRKLPLLNEALRFPYTKFSIVLSLAYAVFFALGIETLIRFLSKFIKSEKITLAILPSAFFILLIVFSLPVFQGNLFYFKEKLVVPKEYFQLFDYFKKQDQNTRIANFPQYTFWGWNYYTWGYGGSGFLWYGIKQPILDRAFDVWSKTDENYYWEISNALYSKNLQAFEAVLNKYQVNWLIVDKNVFNPTSSKALFIPELNSLIAEIPSIQKAKSFGNIDVYKVNLKDSPKSFIFTANVLDSSNGYQWNNFDKAYFDLGNYISSDNPDFYYPFRSLFSNKNQTDKEFDIKNDSNYLTISARLGNKNGLVLNIPSLEETESIIPASLVTEKTGSNLTLSILIQTPEVSIVNGSNSRIIYAQNFKQPLFVIPQNYPNTINVNINGIKSFVVNPSKSQNIGTSFLSLKQENVITTSDNTFKVLQAKTISPSDLISAIDKNNKTIDLSNTGVDSFIEVKILKIKDGYENFEKSPSKDLISQVKNCDNFNNGLISASITDKGMLRLESENSTACISFYIPTLIHNQGYALFVRNENKEGRGLHTWVLNENGKNAPIDTYLDKNQNKTSSFIIPPAENFGQAYSLHFDNISITKDKTVNDLGNISLYPIPYNFLTSIKIANEKIATGKPLVKQNLYISHPNEAYYRVKGITEKKTLILSQSYDEGWHAYAITDENIFNKLFPFLGGKELKNHVLINNWENGWELNNSEFKTQNSEVIIVYIPQYLEFLGFLTMIIALFFVLKLKN